MATPQLSDAEWKVMNALWREHPATARDILGRLEAETGWAYSTVKTMMDRLVEKGALKARIEGITSVYQPLVTQKQARRSALRALKERAFAGTSGSLMHFLVGNERLSASDRKELLRLLKEQERKGGAR